eukprot:CAMPEP_0168536544 /NCGR_PEP_ID=MMETSP0405-20121227/19640_1 /TAXON_ID=498012 /ORGANISM="Trichosphaerium sp, Strain Am-I-7 wt" /LENGTH=537 /DNA_ID=CAMNT_0008564625 /DNA_START=329 /DNA_END=1942 /DNA_ORIENTATION=+
MNKHATIQPGVFSGNITIALNGTGLGIPQGDCPTIGLGGFLSYGGYGALSRTQGLGIDAILEYELVVANGTVLIVNSTLNTDLFFALRGALPAFGIATRIKVKLFDISDFFGGILLYDVPEANASSFLKDWYNTIMNTSDLIDDPNFMTRVNTRKAFGFPSVLRMTIAIMFFGDDSDALKKQRLMPLIDIDNIDFYPQYRVQGFDDLMPADYYNFHLWNFESFLSSVQFFSNLQPYYRHGMLSNERMKSPGTIDSVVDIFVSGFDSTQPVTFGQAGELGIVGGQVTNIPKNETSFFARDFDFVWGWWTSYRTTTEFDAGRQYYDGLASSLTTLSQNRGFYGNLNTIKFSREFDALGTNIPKLESIKEKWDSDNMFSRTWDITPGVGLRCASSCKSTLVFYPHYYFGFTIFLNQSIEFGDLDINSFLSVDLYNPELDNIYSSTYEYWDGYWTPHYHNGTLIHWSYYDGSRYVLLKNVHTSTPKIIVSVSGDAASLCGSLPLTFPVYVRIETGTEQCVHATFTDGLNTHFAFMAENTCD